MYTMEYSVVLRKNKNYAVFSNMDGTIVYLAE